ncbi:MAG: glycosyltransferase family 4 protein [Candidatus Aminicenantes bacterium]|nr:glycosyltransferase family 4 protein [Candidatus Aminicenantes bacterium]
MAICFFGAYDPFYPRTAILCRGLKLLGATLYEWRLPAVKSWIRYPLGLAQAPFKLVKVAQGTYFFVPAFGHKDVPLAFLMGRLVSSPIIFDPLASRYETKIIDWQRKSHDSLTARWNYLLDRFSMKLADLVLADTEAHAHYYCREFGLKNDRLQVLPVGFDDSLWRPSMAINQPQDKPFTAVFFGSFLPLHGVDQIAKAALIVSEKEPSIRFFFIGTGQTFPQVRRLLAKADPKRIQFLGWIKEKKMIKIIEKEASLCFGLFGQTPKAKRVVPHKIFQAMALRKPVLTLDTPAVREFFTHGQNIYLCPQANPETIAASLIELYHQEDLRQRIAQGGYELVWEKFTPLTLAKSLVLILEKQGKQKKWTVSI